MAKDNSFTASAETVLIGGHQKRAIRIREYDVRWPQIFREHRETIVKALGGGALRIEHIGSTSVRGLVAKPIVDILLIVDDPSDEPAYLPALLSASYELRVREPDFD